MSTPVETKVTRAAITAALVTLALYALSFVPFVADMPAAAAGAVLVLVTGAVTYAVAWLAPHTPRPDLYDYDDGDDDPDPEPVEVEQPAEQPAPRGFPTTLRVVS